MVAEGQGAPLKRDELLKMLDGARASLARLAQKEWLQEDRTLLCANVVTLTLLLRYFVEQLPPEPGGQIESSRLQPPPR